MKFPFNDRKTAQAAAELLRLANGKLEYMKLIKLLYLADREMLLAHGRPITGDRMVSMKHGPVLSHVLDFINEGETEPTVWFEYVSPAAAYSVTLAKPVPETDELSRFELGVIRHIFETYGSVDKWKLVDLLHKILPEWKDPGHSALPIDPADILRAESRSEDEIREIADMASELSFLQGPNPTA